MVPVNTVAQADISDVGKEPDPSRPVFNCDATDAVVTLLRYIGEDPEREGLKGTPVRVVKALREMTSGMLQDPKSILSTTFLSDCDQMIIVKGIEFSSLCEHHMLPFSGSAVVGYIPNGKVLGLSKIPRLVRSFSQRLQIQERLTHQIAEAIQDHLNPAGTGVVLSATHSCMCNRGIRSQGTLTCSHVTGLLRDNQSARSEFLKLAQQV